ncbi:hypothetical protein D0T12_17270 [Actinomadura spongiicola]|uniref:Uncharacterized protein n=2 Tax=Actinomadura spongiicola TaxID=2303421 RepID=A0A372GF07_9ACTN|nr:hypothetical protein D0T12_17270 [Actinomadura spongiicola]
MSVAAGSIGLAVIAFCAFRVWLGVRRFGHELERARRRLVTKQSALARELSDPEYAHTSQPRGDGVRSA